MIYLILGIVIGICIILFKDKLIPQTIIQNKDNPDMKNQIEELCNENNTLRNNVRDLKNQIEELMSEIY